MSCAAAPRRSMRSGPFAPSGGTERHSALTSVDRALAKRRAMPLQITSHGGCGGQDVDVVAQTGDLPVAHGEHNDVGKRELAGGCAGPESFLLDDDRFRIVGVVDGKSPVTLILQRVGLPPCGYPVHDL